MAVDESQLEQINTQLSGQYACPIQGCGKDIGFPNAEEAAELVKMVKDEASDEEVDTICANHPDDQKKRKPNRSKEVIAAEKEAKAAAKHAMEDEA